MMCKDGDSCKTWFGADGSMFCRHGLVAEASGTTAVNFKCPLDLQFEQEKEKWDHFRKLFPSMTVVSKVSEVES